MKKKNNDGKTRGTKELIISISAFFVVAVIAVAAVWATIGGNDEKKSAVQQFFDIEYRHPLNGERLSSTYNKLPRVFGVMIENSADAWPLAGLDQAFLVIEAPVEGTIPRFIAFYSEESSVEKIGPVRSARAYYLDWNDALNAVYVHVGGSPEALGLIRDLYDTIDLNQFWQDEYFYRQNGTRVAPHNVYTSSELLISAFYELELSEPEYDVWKFQDGKAVQNPHEGVSVDFTQGSTYDVIWEYQTDSNDYLRYQGKGVMEQEDGAPVVANNVVVMATDMRVVDGEGRLKMVTIGEGDTLIIQNGESFLGRWKQADRYSRLTFYTTDWFEISLNAGITWVEVVSSLSQVGG